MSKEYQTMKNDIYKNYLLVLQMATSTARKIRILTEIFADNPDCWRVVGITKSALKRFKDFKFKRASRMGINRSHIVDRNKTYRRLIEHPIYDIDAFWQFYEENDKTVLSTSSENMSGLDIEAVIPVNVVDLFKNSGFAWRHSKAEVSFLKGLYDTTFPEG
jgi:hypothetical protein